MEIWLYVYDREIYCFYGILFFLVVVSVMECVIVYWMYY